jgi:hypothetical protein
MKFLELKSSNFLEILEYLEHSDFARLSATCKFFMVFFKKNEDFIQRRALSLLGIEYSPSIIPWRSILLKIYKPSNTRLSNSFNPYYTNGGSQGDLGDYFIWNLTQDGGNHCTHLPENVLIKYIYSPDIYIDIRENPVKYKILEDVFNISYLEESANNNHRKLVKIGKIFVKIPLRFCTCPCEILMCFSSKNKVEDFSLIQKFYSCKTKKEVLKNAKLLMLKARVVKTVDHESVVFKKSVGQIQPICWVIADHKKCSDKGFWVKTDDKFIGRYFYVLLISAKQVALDNNIDISNVTPWSRVIEIEKK